ncbi:uncharacterized protein LOC110241053 [Exaiptasia diaphana]|uniref:Peptide-N-glycosidase F N-terminal domain-containing protein n=1 Tax=Exaiptasia diaphana TaxID=2652724 RepID=A0A913YK52_EXADI|nr:uncharacterized protein LOC110241053 [Exaiptasia diaphana]KXJ29739.1 Peptide-N(4)-(N-acetyl-beta-D-glucosaminyl)asparagine amidase F [Exaiptasia diaphana]
MKEPKKWKNILIFYFITLLRRTTFGQLSLLKPATFAPSFTLPTLDGRVTFLKRHKNDTVPQHPIILHAFTSRSAFLEAIWTDKDSLTNFLKHSPRNTRYVFISLGDNAKEDATWMRDVLNTTIHQYYSKVSSTSSSSDCEIDADDELREQPSLLTVQQLKERRKHKNRHHNRQPYRLPCYRHKKPFCGRHKSECHKSQAIENWKKRLHFVTLPMFQLGSYIPYVLDHWQCFGSSCALPQVAVKDKAGDIISVVERLDARYDWLPSPHTFSHRHSMLKLKYYGDACELSTEDLSRAHSKDKLKDKKKSKKPGIIALVIAGKCSLYRKIRNMSQAKAAGILIIQEAEKTVKELTCSGKHCYFPLRIPASMIRHTDGMVIRKRLLDGESLHVSYQSTPTENFFMAIDGQGKLAEVGLFLYPSMMFLGYEAKWFNYKTDLIHNLTGSARIIKVFDHALMKGREGAVATVKLPPIKDLMLYRNVELDMKLHCEGDNDYDCPHWDHVVRLTVCCNNDSVLCDEEIGRWITPYRRNIGHWLTKITPLLPLFTSERCTFRMRHPFWERAWKPSLDIRLSDHIHYSRHHYSSADEDEFIVPYRALKLFEGGKFDKDYNTRYQTIRFKVPPETDRVKLVATITGHGSDNNGCAEFCITSHHFIINGKPNVRVFKNAATAMGCANRVEKGVTPNEHGTWLYGRDGWCPGQDVVPWVVDVTDQVIKNRELYNTIKYYGWFNGSDPNPMRNPGEILMTSFLIFYLPSDDIERKDYL